MKKLKSIFILVILFLLASLSNIYAQQLVYQPVNPSFGGNPLNGNWLLSSAQLQDLTEDPNQVGDQDPFTDFKDNLNRAILNQLTRSLTDQIFGDTGLTEGTFTVGDFTINILNTPDGVQIVLFDVLTGNETTIFIPYP